MSNVRRQKKGISMYRITRSWLLSILLAFLASVGATQEASPRTRFAILSLIGDKLSIVTFVPTTGSYMDRNRIEPVPLSDQLFDRTVLAAAAGAVKHLDPKPALVLATDRSVYEDQRQVLSTGTLQLPEETLTSLRATGASKLILVTKHRGPASLSVAQGIIGDGKLEGLGFYLNGSQKIRRSDTGMSGKGFIAPYLYAAVSVVDLSSLAIDSTVAIQTGYVLSAARDESGVEAWGVLSTEQKVEALQKLIRRHVPAALSKLTSEGNQLR